MKNVIGISFQDFVKIKKESDFVPNLEDCRAFATKEKDEVQEDTKKH